MLQSRPIPPKSVHALTHLALTDGCHFVHISYKAEKEATQEAKQEARVKSKAGEELTEQQSRYIARYCHPALCCSLARFPPSLHMY